jgi:hypothetical protein
LLLKNFHNLLKFKDKLVKKLFRNLSIKDGTAFPATIIQDRGAIVHVGTLPARQQMPVGTAQTLRMEDILQKMVTFLLIQPIGQGKTDHGTVALDVPDFGRIPQTLCGSHLPWGFIHLPI